MSNTPLDRILNSIEELPADARLRIETVADMLRAMLCHDDAGEVELAMLWVMEELNSDGEACEACEGTVQ